MANLSPHLLPAGSVLRSAQAVRTIAALQTEFYSCGYSILLLNVNIKFGFCTSCVVKLTPLQCECYSCGHCILFFSKFLFFYSGFTANRKLIYNVLPQIAMHIDTNNMDDAITNMFGFLAILDEQRLVPSTYVCPLSITHHSHTPTCAHSTRTQVHAH